MNASDICAKYLDEMAPKIAPMIDDTVGIVHSALRSGRRILLEGPKRRSSTSITGPTRS